MAPSGGGPLQGLLGAWMLGYVVVVEAVGLLAVLVEHHRDLKRLVVLEAVGFCVDGVEVPIVELISFNKFSISFRGLEVPRFLMKISGWTTRLNMDLISIFV